MKTKYLVALVTPAMAAAPGPGKAFFVCLRMYGPTEPWIEGKWRPSNVDLVK